MGWVLPGLCRRLGPDLLLLRLTSSEVELGHLGSDADTRLQSCCHSHRWAGPLPWVDPRRLEEVNRETGRGTSQRSPLPVPQSSASGASYTWSVCSETRSLPVGRKGGTTEIRRSDQGRGVQQEGDTHPGRRADVGNIGSRPPKPLKALNSCL